MKISSRDETACGLYEVMLGSRAFSWMCSAGMKNNIREEMAQKAIDILRKNKNHGDANIISETGMTPGVNQEVFRFIRSQSDFWFSPYHSPSRNEIL